MASLNKIILIGNVGNNPEMRVTPNGSAVTTFSLAVNKASVDENGKSRTITDWFKVNTWKRLAETCNQYVSKGKLIYVEGSIHISEYMKDNIKHYSLEVTAERVTFLPSDSGSRATIDKSELSTEEPPFEE
jgi:single-strand DNA-binding protein